MLEMRGHTETNTNTLEIRGHTETNTNMLEMRGHTVVCIMVAAIRSSLLRTQSYHYIKVSSVML